MEKKTECEIVQDLLLSYADDVLNQASKKLVEKHLLECGECQERLNEIQWDKQKQEENQKTQIDYLKKVRRRNKIHSILGAILILVVIFASWYGRKYCILTGLAQKAQKQFESENFYMETIGTLGTNGEIGFDKIWYKDGKYKQVSYIEKEEQIMQIFETRYGNLRENAKEAYFVNEVEKKVRKEKLTYEVSKYDFCGVRNPIWLTEHPHNRLLRFGAPFFTKISTDHKEIGRLYYVLEMENGKQWVDKETGLPIMIFGYRSNTEYYRDTKIPVRHAEGISEYHYEFESVTDEDVKMPDLEQYEVEEFDWVNEVDQVKACSL